jgi:DNA-directed RNA polymerase subunit RPC12/RpoP
MKELRLFETHDCPYCGQNVFETICDDEQVISVSDRYEKFDHDGFRYYRNYTYACPYCGEKFYASKRSFYANIKKSNHV